MLLFSLTGSASAIAMHHTTSCASDAVVVAVLQGYQSVLADVATYTGMLTLASMVVSRLVFQYAGWGVAASVTPAVMGLAGVVFFGASLTAQLPGLSPELAATVAGVGATAGVVTQVTTS